MYHSQQNCSEIRSIFFHATEPEGENFDVLLKMKRWKRNEQYISNFCQNWKIKILKFITESSHLKTAL